MASNPTFSLAVVLVTYDRVADARRNMKIMRQIWGAAPWLRDLEIIHVFNGRRAWYPRRTQEDVLLRLPRQSHFLGAAAMIDAGIATVLKRHHQPGSPTYDAIVVCSADAWLADLEVLHTMVKRAAQPKPGSAQPRSGITQPTPQLISSWWYLPGLVSTEWLMLNPAAAAQIFPLHFSRGLGRLAPFLTWTKMPLVEMTLSAQCLRAGLTFSGPGLKFSLIPGRRWVQPGNRFHSPRIKYFSHHSLPEKQKLFNRAVRD